MIIPSDFFSRNIFLTVFSSVELSSPAVSHHLRLLKSAGLIVSRRQGKEMYYRAADTEPARVLHHTIEQLAALTCPGEEERP